MASPRPAVNAVLATLLPLVLLALVPTSRAHGGHGHGSSRNLMAPGGKAAVPGVPFGKDALTKLKDKLPQVAVANGISQAELNKLLQDDDIGVHEAADNRLIASCAGMVADPSVALPPRSLLDETAPSNATIDPSSSRHLLQTSSVLPGDADPSQVSANPFNLHSRPGAPTKIVLDFDGCVLTNTAWNVYNGNRPTITIPPYDTDNNPSTSFTASERQDIIAIWRAVAEDYAPFNVDVTTQDPGGSPALYGSKACIGGSSSLLNISAGGIAYIGVFKSNSYYHPALVFTAQLGKWPKYIWEATSHEVGHNLGLYHDGTATVGYYQGHGSGSTGWAPIMGVGYYKEVTQWSKGEYTGANNQEDDIAKIAAKTGYANDYGSTTATATDITASLGKRVNGIVERTGVPDVFKFTVTSASAVTAAVVVPPAWTNSGNNRANLDVVVQLLGPTGTALATSNSATALPTTLSANVAAAGTYYVTITGGAQASPTTGWSTYASLGQYALTVTATPTAGRRLLR